MSAIDIPQRWPLVTNPLNRASSFTQDGRLVNCYGELNPQTNEFDILKRPGRKVTSVLLPSSGTGLGMRSWVGANDLIQIRFISPNTNVYNGATNIGTVVGAYYEAFEPIQSATPTLFFKSNGTGYTTDGATVTQIVDVNWLAYPTVVGGIAQLNGRCYVITQNGRIYSATNLNDATVWSTNFIVANDNPDLSIGIVRHLQYILALKTTSVETFYDAGNATGSPLSRVPGVRIPYGCVDFRTVVTINDTLYWVTNNSPSSTRKMGPQIVRMADLEAQVISSPNISRILEAYTIVGAFPLYVNGHRFYCLQFDNTTTCLVWDVEQQLWSEWVIDVIVSGYGAATTNTWALQGATGAVFNFDKTLGADYTSTVIPFDIYTPNMDFEVNRDKTLWALYINGDQQPGSMLQIRHTDDDFQTWSNYRQCDLSLKKPFITDEGSFFRRAYHFHHESDTVQRLRSCGLQMDIGVL